METVGTSSYGRQLKKFGFSPRLCASEEQCKEWLDFCKRTDMVWFSKSYGTLVHKNFDKHFTRLEGNELTKAKIELAVMDDRYNTLISLNHSNGIKSKINGAYFVTSSPNYVEWDNIKKYPYTVFIIHPSLLEDYGLDKINFAFSNITYAEIDEINKAIYDDIGLYKAFRYFTGSFKEENGVLTCCNGGAQ